MHHLFEIGKISLQNRALATVSPEVMVQVINNHLCGIWGTISDEIHHHNVDSLKNWKGSVISNQIFGEETVNPIIFAMETNLTTGTTTLSIKNM
jgi:hypothetical protein